MRLAVSAVIVIGVTLLLLSLARPWFQLPDLLLLFGTGPDGEEAARSLQKGITAWEAFPWLGFTLAGVAAGVAASVFVPLPLRLSTPVLVLLAASLVLVIWQLLNPPERLTLQLRPAEGMYLALAGCFVAIGGMCARAVSD